MNRIAFATIVAMVLSFCLVSNEFSFKSIANGQGERWLTYERSYPFAMSIQYPDDWLYTEPESNWVSFFTGNFSIDKGFTNTSNVNVILDNRFDYKNMPLDIYSQLAIRQLELDHPGFKITEFNMTQIGIDNLPAYRIEYQRAGYGNEIMKGIMYFFVKSPDDYYISFVSPSQYFESDLKIAERMIDSFKFLQ